MNQLVRTTLNLEQYQCQRCGRFFYINALDRGSLDLDFGCPYGCDDNGKHTRDISTEIKEVVERGEE
jgi:hypothetical protein